MSLSKHVESHLTPHFLRETIALSTLQRPQNNPTYVESAVEAKDTHPLFQNPLSDPINLISVKKAKVTVYLRHLWCRGIHDPSRHSTSKYAHPVTMQ